MARASYRKAVEWIALNDDTAETDARNMSYTISVLLIADIFGKDPMGVANAVIRFRKKEGLI